METYKQRVVDEKRDLLQKKAKLQKFICTNIFERLATAEQRRLRRQSTIMDLYDNVLEERIAEF